MQGWRKGKTQTTNKLLTDSSTSLEKFQNVDPKTSTIQVFVFASINFAENLSEFYPDEPAFKKYVDESPDVEDSLDLVKGRELALQFNKLFSKHTKLVLSKDESLFEEEELRPFDAKTKYDSATDEQKEYFWETFKNLVQYASMVDMYDTIPSGMMNSIGNLAGSLMGKFKAGEMDMNSLNPMEIGEMMMRDISNDEIEQFGRSLMESGNIENLMAMMQSTLGSTNMGGMMDMLKK